MNSDRQAVILAADRKGGQAIELTTRSARTVFVAGKRGTGKSYTLGRLIEEVHRLGEHLIVVIDPLAVFWSTAIPEPGQTAIPTRVIIPGDPDRVLGADLMAAMTARGVTVDRLWLNAADLSPSAWCALFGYNLTEPQGIALYRAVHACAGVNPRFNLADINAALSADEETGDRTKDAVANRLSLVADWGLFATTYTPTLDVLQYGAVNVVDVASFDPGPQSIRNLVAKLLIEQLFRARLSSRRAEVLGQSSTFPRVWLFVDEAHDFCPGEGDALAKSALIRWVKEGRQPGLSLAVATQQPAALSFDLISQCDALVIHRLTLQDDVKVVTRLASTYASDLAAFLKGIRTVGEGIFVDDALERVVVGRVLPRRAKHGGGEAL